MLAFDLKQVKHALYSKGNPTKPTAARSPTKIRARVLGKMFPTIETETGRAAVCPPGLQGWLSDMGIVAQSRAEFRQE